MLDTDTKTSKMSGRNDLYTMKIYKIGIFLSWVCSIFSIFDLKNLKLCTKQINVCRIFFKTK